MGETYLVQLTAFNSICPPNTYSRLISFAPPPIPMFDTNIEGGCPGTTVQFTDLSENATDWEWTFEGAVPFTSNEQNPIVIYVEAGVHNVTLGVSNASGSNAITFLNVIEIDTAAIAMFSIEQNGANINFINESLYAVDYEWNFGDGIGSNDFNPSHLFGDNGTFEVQLTAFNPTCGWDTTMQSITVLVPPIIDFIFNPQEDCDDVEIEFMDNSSYSPTVWEWTFSGGIPASSNDPNPSVFYEESGTYEVNLTVSNEAGSESLSQNLTINTNLSLAESYELCEDDTLFIYNTFFTKNNTQGTIIFEGDGIANCDTIITVEVDILENVNVAIRDTIIEGDTLIFGNLVLTEQGTYSQTFIADNNCDSTVFLRLIVVPRGQFTPFVHSSINDWSVFPNPFKEVIYFSFSLEKNAKVSLAIFDTYGRLIEQLTTEEQKRQGQYSIKWTPLQKISGVYWCRLQLGKAIFWKKIVNI